MTSTGDTCLLQLTPPPAGTRQGVVRWNVKARHQQGPALSGGCWEGGAGMGKEEPEGRAGQDWWDLQVMPES